MEFIERLPLDRLHFLKTLSFKEYKPYDKSSSKNDDERKKNYEKLQRFCDNFIKANGTIKRLYKFTGNHNWDRDGNGAGRLFADGNGIQGLPKKIRGFLLNGITTDIDMVNAHPVILRYLCRIHNIPHKELNFYIEHRDEVLSQFPDRETGKTLFLKATNDEKVNRKETNPVFKAYDKEMKNIQKIITKLTCYENVVEDVPANKLYNWYGSAVNRIMCFYENKILQVIMEELNRQNLEICAPMFDGVMPYGICDKSLLMRLEELVNTAFPQLDMKLSFKEHDTSIVMPDDFKIPVAVNEEKLKTFDKIAEEFEKTHCKIVNDAVFVREYNNDIIILSKPQLKTAYEHITYEKLDKDNNVVVDNFISKWLVNNDKQRKYDTMELCPTGVECPPNVFNLWRNFEMENVTEYEPKPDELNVILNHIKILCNHEDAVYDYFIKWIAQMIQFPAVKTICPTLISSQGAGKGTLMKLFCKMLGDKKVFETTNPARDVWGDFNGCMCNTFLVNLNELSKKDTLDSEGKIKGLITDEKLTINNKGVNAYKISSYHRFIITTNKEEPINTSKDDRRNLIIRSSDEKCGDKEYFNTLHKMLDDVNVVKTCYEYFKSVEGVDVFNKIPMPITEHQQNLKQLSVSPIEMWLEDLVLQNYEKNEVEMLGSQAVSSFKAFCDKNKLVYAIDAKKLGVRLANMRLSAITKGRHTNKGETKIYNIQQLKEHFKLGKIEIITDDNKVEEIEY